VHQDTLPVLMTHGDPRTEDLEVLDDQAQEALALLQSLGEPPCAALTAGPTQGRRALATEYKQRTQGSALLGARRYEIPDVSHRDAATRESDGGWTLW